MNPEELRELLGAFALDAIDDQRERERVQHFLLDDADARAELHELEQAVGWLGHASPQPSAGSWDAVRRAIAQDLADEAQPSRPTDPAPDPEPVTSIADFTARRSARYWKPLAAVAAAIMLIFAIGGIAGLVGDDSRSTQIQRVALSAPDGSTAAEVTLRADGTGTIHSTTLPKAPDGHIYQLWAQTSHNATMHSAGVLGASVRDESVRVPSDAVRVAISVEPDGGSVRPTTDPVALSGTF